MLKLKNLFDNRDLAKMILENWEYDPSSSVSYTHLLYTLDMCSYKYIEGIFLVKKLNLYTCNSLSTAN